MQTSPEIRFRIDRTEREQFEQVARQVGMDTNEMVRVFIRRAIAAGGFPFEMRAPAQERAATSRLLPNVDEFAPVAGFTMRQLDEVGRRAAQAAHDEHVKAGRMPPASAEQDPGRTR